MALRDGEAADRQRGRGRKQRDKVSFQEVASLPQTTQAANEAADTNSLRDAAAALPVRPAAAQRRPARQSTAQEEGATAGLRPQRLGPAPQPQGLSAVHAVPRQGRQDHAGEEESLRLASVKFPLGSVLTCVVCAVRVCMYVRCVCVCVCGALGSSERLPL